MRNSDRRWKTRAIKALKKTIKKFKKPDGKSFGNIGTCEFCKIYFTYWGYICCDGCPFKTAYNANVRWKCFDFKCYREFIKSIRHHISYPGRIIDLTSEEKELANKCVEVMEGILYILKKLPDYKFQPTAFTYFPELKELRER